MKTFNGLIGKPENSNQILVGGVNYDGIHGAGVARLALEHWGAIYGQARGLQGQFYGIITKDLKKKKHPSVSVGYILYQLDVLSNFAENNPRKEFLIAYTAGGYNLNGYTSKQMANMFAQINWPENVVFEDKFHELMLKNKKESIYQP